MKDSDKNVVEFTEVDNTKNQLIHAKSAFASKKLKMWL